MRGWHRTSLAPLGTFITWTLARGPRAGELVRARPRHGLTGVCLLIADSQAGLAGVA